MVDDQNHNIQADSVGKTACPRCGSIVDVSSVPAFDIVKCPQCDAQFAAPGKLGQFILLRELGKGEMGATYKAYEKSLGRYVAIKVMHRSMVDSAGVESFFSEGRALASLDHPNIVRVFSLGQEKDQPYIVMELIPGGGMEQLFAKDKPLDEVRALEIMTGVARALRAASEIGLIHGDIKPENIMLNEKGRAKLVDFGIARFGGGKIADGDALGTPYYVAPEQVQRASLDHRADIYSLGATMYHALTGEPPFTGDSLLKVLYARIEQPVPDITEACPSIHPETAAIVTRMLQIDPEDRYAGYDELLKDLLKACWATGAEIIQDSEEAIPVADKLGGLDLHKHHWLLIGAVVVLLAVVGWAVFFRGGNPPPPKPDTRPAVRTVSDPILSPPGGTVVGPTEVTIKCGTTGARIHYTTDGTAPTTDSPLYHDPVIVPAGATLRARAFRDQWKTSSVAEALYALDSDVLKEVVTLRADADTLWQQVKGYDPGQGFAKKLEEGSKLFMEAEAFYAKDAYAACKEPYRQLKAVCKELKERQGERLTAGEAGQSARAARKLLTEASSRSVRADIRKTDQAIKRAQVKFKQGEFTEADKHWQTAEKHADAELTALTKKHSDVFDNLLKKYNVKELDEFGGDGWARAKAAAAAAKQAETKTPQERVDAAKACAKAIGQLPAIAKTAATAAHNAGTAAAQAAKAAKIKKELDAAEKLLTAGRLRKAMATVEEVLKLDRNHKEARKLQTRIRDKLMFSLRTGEIKVSDRLVAGDIEFKLVWIPAGEFLMGSPPTEKDRVAGEKLHKVQITKPFYIGRYEITRGQYELYERFQAESKYQIYIDKRTREKGEALDQRELNQALQKARQAYNRITQAQFKKNIVNGWDSKRWGRIPGLSWKNTKFPYNNNSPVVCVNWIEATDFCKWLSKQTGKTVRLATEAEWEMACRAGTTTAYSFGDDPAQLHRYGNYRDQSSNLPGNDPQHKDNQVQSNQMGRYAANPWGVHDMHGGVREWCSDRSGAYRKTVADPRGPTSGSQRIVRGGSWYSVAKDCRSAARDDLLPVNRDTATGFRIVVEAR